MRSLFEPTTIALVGAGVAAAASTAGTVYAASQKPDAPSLPKPKEVEKEEKEAEIEGRRKARMAAAGRTGRSKSLLTGGSGSQVSSENVGKSTLLGGGGNRPNA